MKTLEFKVWVDCTPEELWDTLWTDETYREWTSVFHEGSHAVSDWKQGSEIRFMSPEGDGIYSVIERMESPRFMTFAHQGEVKNNEKQPPSEWSGSFEKYELISEECGTMLLVTLDTTNEFADYFTGTFSLALQKVKDIAELKYEHEFITVRVDIPVTKAKAWEVFIHPDHIMEWNHAGEDWRCPAATNDLRVGGKFVYRMEPKRGKDGFNFTGTYTAVDRFELIAYELGDGRKVVVRFIERGDTICVFESFHPEAVHPRIAQRGGWQMIMDNYAKQSTS